MEAQPLPQIIERSEASFRSAMADAADAATSIRAVTRWSSVIRG